MYGTLDVSVSGMVAERTRLNSIQANIANAHAMTDSAGNYAPYHRRAVMFSSGDPSSSTPEGQALGVHVSEITADPNALRKAYDPTSPFADKEGNVIEPDINPAVETVNAMEAVRAYEANVAAAEATKSILASALRLIS